MHRSNLLAFANLWQFFIDVAILVLSFFLSFIIASHFTQLYALSEYVWIIIVFVPIWLFSMVVLRMYNNTTFTYPDRLLRSIVWSSLAAGMIVAALFIFIKETQVSGLLYGVYVGLSTVLLAVSRFFYIFVILRRKSEGSTRVLIVGTPQLAKKFRVYLAKTNIKIHIVGYVQPFGDKPLKRNYHVGYLKDLEDILVNNIVDEVIFALPQKYVNRNEPYILKCEEIGITARVMLDLYDLRFSRIHLSSIGTFPLLTYHSVTINKVNLLFKRIIDILGAIVGLSITALVSLVIVPAIMLESKGPAVFSQDRVGLNGRTFKIYKFRSMYMDAEERKQVLMEQNQIDGGFMFKMKDDPRITRMGKILRKTSLDELPQFINVLRGEMSLVGTRPPTLDEVSRYETYHRRRLSFKPGLTGLWQVSGRSNITDFDEVVKLDISYIDEWSLWLDVKIIVKTVQVIFRPRSGAM